MRYEQHQPRRRQTATRRLRPAADNRPQVPGARAHPRDRSDAATHQRIRRPGRASPDQVAQGQSAHGQRMPRSRPEGFAGDYSLVPRTDQCPGPAGLYAAGWRGRGEVICAASPWATTRGTDRGRGAGHPACPLPLLSGVVPTGAQYSCPDCPRVQVRVSAHAPPRRRSGPSATRPTYTSPRGAKRLSLLTVPYVPAENATHHRAADRCRYGTVMTTLPRMCLLAKSATACGASASE